MHADTHTQIIHIDSNTLPSIIFSGRVFLRRIYSASNCLLVPNNSCWMLRDPENWVNVSISVINLAASTLGLMYSLIRMFWRKNEIELPVKDFSIAGVKSKHSQEKKNISFTRTNSVVYVWFQWHVKYRDGIRRMNCNTCTFYISEGDNPLLGTQYSGF